MQIPLDYYRILGVPIQATDELLTQAYHDRFLQLPRREYSQYAIIARKQLLEQAYEILSDSHKRNDYKARFFTANYQESTTVEIETDTNLESDIDVQIESETPSEKTPEYKEEAYKKPSFEGYYPYLEINEDLFLGALLILLELGEYELVLKLAQPYLDGQKKLESSENKTEQLQAIWSDLILTIAIAYIELGREQWQLGEYESAFQSQEKGLQLLIQENLFNILQEEIKNDLHKLRPYLIVEILEKEKSDSYKRNQALNLLHKMLDERGGIEGQGVDKSGLNLDDFLRFIQQIRVYLTVKEQEKLFEIEAKRPSPAASYLFVYALIARGFSERKPAFLVRSKNILISLTERQDVYLEQAICALLLGQTEEAEFALGQSQEEEAINYIKEHSQGSPDLLPGLCLYGEKWLQTEVFPQFSNLNNQKSSLKEYFADQQVQNYLEQLVLNPTEAETDSSINFNQGSDYFLKQQNLQRDLTINQQESDLEKNIFTNIYTLKDSPDSVSNENFNFVGFNSVQTNSEAKISDSNLLTLTETETDSQSITTENDDLVSFDSFLKSKLEEDYVGNNQTSTPETDSSLPNKSTVKSQSQKHKLTKTQSQNNLLWLAIILLLSSIIAIIIYNLVLNKKEEKLALSISKPLIELPVKTTEVKPVATPKTLDTQQALNIVQNWLEAKEKATGAEYQINEFNKVLTEPLLSRWRSSALSLQNDNAYHNYDHTMSIENVKIVNPNQAIIIGKINESSKFYRDGSLVPSKSYNEKLKVQYDLIKNNNQWLIKDIKVIK